MTNGSCQSRCESKVQTLLNRYSSACRASSMTLAAGGSVCKTTPKSMSDEVLREPALEEPAVTRMAKVASVIDDDLAARQHRVDVTVDLEALPGGVVHVHVVRLTRTEPDRRVAGRIVDDDVRVGAGGDDALAAVEAEHPGRGGGADLDPALEADPAVGDTLGDHVDGVLDGTDAVGNLREVADAQLFLVLHAERAVVGGHGGDVAGADIAPQLVLMALGPAPERGRADPFGALEAG